MGKYEAGVFFAHPGRKKFSFPIPMFIGIGAGRLRLIRIHSAYVTWGGCVCVGRVAGGDGGGGMGEEYRRGTQREMFLMFPH